MLGAGPGGETFFGGTFGQPVDFGGGVVMPGFLTSGSVL